MSEQDLLPCPFCGAHLVKPYPDRQDVYRHPEGTGCFARKAIIHPEEYDTWNTRTVPTVAQASQVLWKEFNSSNATTNFKPAWNAWKHKIWACDGSIYSAMSAWLRTLAGGSHE